MEINRFSRAHALVNTEATYTVDDGKWAQQKAEGLSDAEALSEMISLGEAKRVSWEVEVQEMLTVHEEEVYEMGGA